MFAKLDALRAELGDPPAGFGVRFPVKDVQRARLRKYVCSTKLCSDGSTAHPVIRSASDTLKVSCDTCQNGYVIA